MTKIEELLGKNLKDMTLEELLESRKLWKGAKIGGSGLKTPRTETEKTLDKTRKMLKKQGLSDDAVEEQLVKLKGFLEQGGA